MQISITSHFVPVGQLDQQEIETMTDLYLRHYDGSSKELFERDLSEKDEVLLLYENSTLIGFSTLKVIYMEHPKIRVLFSGDTVVARDHWGQQKLALEWIVRAGQIFRDEPQCPLYWMLLVKGHRTYRYLPAFTFRWYPSWKQADEELQGLADTLGNQIFGESYDANRGVIHFGESRGHLKADIAQPTARERRLPAVQFFLDRNPGYQHGDELVCITELVAGNLRPFAARLFESSVSP